LLASPGLGAVLLLRGLDGTLRNSLNRMATELAYLPVPATARARAKPFLDGALTRATQGVVGMALIAVSGGSALGQRGLAVLVATVLMAWTILALTTYRPYLDLLRRAIASGRPIDDGPEIDHLDFETAETLVQQLASFDAAQVIGAMNMLARRKRGRLIPALVLLHETADVLVRALRIFSGSQGDDWVSRARRLMGDPRESVRTAAARALAAARQLRPEDVAGERSDRIRGYAVLYEAIESGDPDLRAQDSVQEILMAEGPTGDEARLGLLEAVATIDRNERLLPLLEALAARAGMSRAWNEALASAASAQGGAAMIPHLMARLPLRDGREAVQQALVSLGPPAQGAVWQALLEPNARRTLRAHLPNTLARFGSNEAALLLLQLIDAETDGMVRYKAIRALGRLVSETGIRVDRGIAEHVSHRYLVEHFRLLGLRAQFDEVRISRADPSPEDLTARLLLGLLDDKLRQSLERTFRLLKIAHPHEDIHTVHLWGVSRDARARARAAEFLDTLLRRREQRSLRELLRLVVDDVSNAERVRLAAGLIPYPAPLSREEALLRLVKDADAVVSSLAALHVATLEGKAARGVVGRASLEHGHE
jgi:AAA family ATP:ADP antiporter